MRPMKKPRVLVCDDSPLMRRVLTDLLIDGGLDVIGQVSDGADLLAKVRELSPDVVTLDVEMPRKDGLAALRELMIERPIPVVMVSTLTGTGTRATIQALALGAVDVVQKPALRLTPELWGRTRDELLEKVLNASRARVRSARTPSPEPARAHAEVAATVAPAPDVPRTGSRILRRSAEVLVVIATSTGGPRALHELLPRLPARVGAGVLIVQHMPLGFTKPLAERLDGESALTVREALPSDAIRPDVALVAPAGRHLEVVSRGRVGLSDAPAIGNLKPRADVTMASAATVYGRDVLVVVLTGMGADGESGARAVKAAGGRVLSEHESTCVIYGMPRAIERAGLCDAAVPLDAMHLAIRDVIAKR
jgi:two-component system, chemotaxis family, protein-glutamate methylesterase/glutaminase